MMNVISNLLDNAVKYSSGAPEIEVFTRREGDMRIIGVQDHGIGISKRLNGRYLSDFTGYRVEICTM